jgi:hypothetical protein
VVPIDGHDRRILDLLAEHRIVVVPHVAALLGIREAAAAARLRNLRGAGLAGYERIFSGQPAASWITRPGLGLIASRLPAPRLDLKGYRHDVGLAWLWLAAQRGAFGPLERQVSERGMRSHDRRRDREGPPLGLGIGAAGARGGPGRHYPDLLLETRTGHRVAVELELTSKSAHRLQRIMRTYAAAPQIDAVLYLCPGGRVARGVSAAARRAGIGDIVHVQLLAEGSPQGALEPGREPARVAAASRTRSRARAAAPRGGARAGTRSRDASASK